MGLTGYTDNLPEDTILDHGTVYDGPTKIGVTRGGVKWDPGWTIENIPFDGSDTPIKGLDRKFYGEPMLSFTLIEFGPTSPQGAQIEKLEAGSAAADSGTTPNTLTTITPKAGRQIYASGDYLSDIRVLFHRAITPGAGVKQYAAIYLPCALVRKWSLAGGDKDAATIDVELVGRKDMASGTTADAAYKIELRESEPT